MAEIKSKKSWYKRWWAITLFILIGLAVLGNLFGGKNTQSSSNSISSSDNYKNSANIKNPDEKTQTITSSGDFCRSIIPERIKLLCHTTDNEVNTGRTTCINSPNETYKWNDGNSITGTIWFEKGWRTGENVNYLYLASYLGYEKIPTSADGTIGEKISYRVMWILDPNDQNVAGFKVKSYKCCQSTKYNPCDILGTSYKNW